MADIVTFPALRIAIVTLKRNALLFLTLGVLIGCASPNRLKPEFLKVPEPGSKLPYTVAYAVAVAPPTENDINPCTNSYQEVFGYGTNYFRQAVHMDISEAKHALQREIDATYQTTRRFPEDALKSADLPAEGQGADLMVTAWIYSNNIGAKVFDPEPDNISDRLLWRYSPHRPGCVQQPQKLKPQYEHFLTHSLANLVAALRTDPLLSRYPREKAQMRRLASQAREAAATGEETKAFALYRQALALLPFDGRINRDLRTEFVKFAQSAKERPPIPQEATDSMIRAREFTKLDKPREADEEYVRAILAVPWWPDAYFNRAVALEATPHCLDSKRGRLAYGFYLLADPQAKDRDTVRTRMLQMEVKEKSSNAKCWQ